jgi:hypothetical protein
MKLCGCEDSIAAWMNDQKHFSLILFGQLTLDEKAGWFDTEV